MSEDVEGNGKPGRPPNVPPSDAAEEEAIQAEILRLKGGVEDGRVNVTTLERFKEDLRVEWVVRLKFLVRRASGKDAEALMKLGLALLYAEPKSKREPRTKE